MTSLKGNTSDEDFFWRFSISLRDGTANSSELDRFEQLLINNKSYRELYLRASRIESELIGASARQSLGGLASQLSVYFEDSEVSVTNGQRLANEQENAVLDLVKEIQLLPEQNPSKPNSNILAPVAITVEESPIKVPSSSINISSQSPHVKSPEPTPSSSLFPSWVQQMTVPTLTSVILHTVLIGLLGTYIIRNSQFGNNYLSHVEYEDSTSNQSEQSVFNDANAIAFVARQENAVWANGEKVKLRTGLSRGIYSLKSGTVELILRNEVHLAFSTNTEVDIRSTSTLNLQTGSIDARVPKSEAGFTVVTPIGKVVDLGTEFQVSLTNLKTMSVDVREGTVLISPTDNQFQSLPLVAGKSAKVREDGTMEVSISKNNPSPFDIVKADTSEEKTSHSIGPVQDCSLVTGDQKKKNRNDHLLHIYSLDHRTDHAILQFDLARFQNDDIESATLVLHATHIYGKNERRMPMTIHAITQPWRATEATWENRLRQTPWDIQGGDFDPKVYASADDHPAHDAPIAWDVTELVREWYSPKRENFGLLIKSSHPNQLHFHSMDTSSPSLRPQLILVNKKR